MEQIIGWLDMYPVCGAVSLTLVVLGVGGIIWAVIKAALESRR